VLAEQGRGAIRIARFDGLQDLEVFLARPA
jgi:hypothetical protein